MNRPVIAIGLDAADSSLMEKWMEQGYLPTLSYLRENGAFSLLKNTINYGSKTGEFYTTEPLWTSFVTGCKANTTGFWDTVKYFSDRYDIDCNLTKAYEYHDYPPFYSLAKDKKIAIFDLPTTIIDPQIKGTQILGWGGHFPYTKSESHPPEILPNIIKKHGKNPILFKDSGIWWDRAYVKWLRSALKDSIKTRTEICKNLLKSQKWDLFLAVYGELHTVGHDIYNYGQPDHPIYPHLPSQDKSPNPVLEAYQAVDNALGDILHQVPPDAYIIVFSLHGMGPNFSDMLSMAFLPEILYRLNFPGKIGIGPNPALDKTIPPLITHPIRGSWTGEIWSKIYEENPLARHLRPWLPSRFLRDSQNGLASPYPLVEEGVPMGWMPARWYQPCWQEMKAFALPSFTSGHIRINLEGRDPQGKVSEAEYDEFCRQLEDILYALKDGRTNQPVVKEIIRTRISPQDRSPNLPDADLIVLWQENMTDVVDSPDFGRIGPLTHFRAGGHWNRGFCLIKGPGISPHSSLAESEAVDLTPTILALMGEPIPDYFEGKTLFEQLVYS